MAIPKRNSVFHYFHTSYTYGTEGHEAARTLIELVLQAYVEGLRNSLLYHGGFRMLCGYGGSWVELEEDSEKDGW